MIPPALRISSLLLFAVFFLVLPSAVSSAKIVSVNPRTTRKFAATQVTLTTPWTASTVLKNLDLAVNRAAYEADTGSPSAPIPVPNRTAFEALIEKKLGPFGFTLFNQITYDSYMAWWNEPLGKPTPIMRRYTIGNPLIAATMVVYDVYAGLNVPVDVIVVSDYGLNGTAPNGAATTRIVWDLPSSLIALDGKGKVGTEQYALWNATRVLDDKLEVMLKNVTGN